MHRFNSGVAGLLIFQLFLFLNGDDDTSWYI